MEFDTEELILVFRVFNALEAKCFNGVSSVFHGCHKGVPRVFKWCFGVVTRVIQGCFKGALGVFKGCFCQAQFQLRFQSNLIEVR